MEGTPPRTKTSPLMEDMIDAVRARFGPYDRETLIRTIGYCRSIDSAIQRCRSVLEPLGQNGTPAAPYAAGFPWARPAGYVPSELAAIQAPSPAAFVDGSELAGDDSVTIVRSHVRRRRPRPVAVNPDLPEASSNVAAVEPEPELERMEVHASPPPIFAAVSGEGPDC